MRRSFIMEILSRPLNKGEVFPCSFKSAKSFFKDTDVVLNFAKYSRVFGTFANTTDAFYVKKNISGRIIASMYMHYKKPCPLLNFFVLKDCDFNEALTNKFESKVLLHFHNFYTEVYNTPTKNQTEVMLVELQNSDLKMHRFKFK